MNFGPDWHLSQKICFHHLARPFSSKISTKTSLSTHFASKISRMPKHLSHEARETIKMRLLERKLDHVDIADEVGTSIQTVKNYSVNLRYFGDILPPKLTRRGRPPILTQEMINVCLLTCNWLHYADVLLTESARLYWGKTILLSVWNDWFLSRGVRH
jgi:hypothetical protein